MKKEPVPAGPKTKMTPEILNKLEIAWQLGASDAIACKSAGITPSTLRKYLNENPEYYAVMDKCKSQLILQALSNTTQAMLGKAHDGKPYSKNQDECNKVALETSKWMLTHGQAKADFATRTELTGADGKPLNSLEINLDLVKEMDKHFNETYK